MAIRLLIDPTTPPRSWRDFVKTAPPYSIALDGYVHGGPRYSAKGPKANFNHHEEVDRLATRSTCAQVLVAVRQGLFDAFRDEKGEATAEVYVNDCDEDVCTSWAIISQPHLATYTMSPMLNRLVAMEDMLDCTAGAYPYPRDLPILQELAWIFEPYRQFRLSGQLDKKNKVSYRSVITDVSNRIMSHLTGNGKKVPIDTRFDRIGGGKHWTMVREVGAQSRTGMFSEGIRVFVAVRERGDGIYTYTIGKMSPFLPLDLSKLTERLNTMEDAVHPDLWGGGDTIIGSPRVAGSRLSPEKISEFMDRAFEGDT